MDMEAYGPLEEVAFWRQRSFDLGGIRKQLINPVLLQSFYLLPHYSHMRQLCQVLLS